MFKIYHKVWFVIVYMSVVCVLFYILGGSETVAGFMNQNMVYKWGVGAVVFAIALFLTIFGFMKFDLDKRISEFSWRNWYEQFVKRYHWNRVDKVILLLALLGGGILRLTGYNWRMTSIFQPDECNLIAPSVAMALSGSVYHNNFYYPSQLLSRIAAWLAFFYGKATEGGLNYQTMPEVYYIFRVIVAIVGIITIFVCFLIGNYLKKHLGAIIAVLVSIFPPYISLAKQVTGDVTVLFFLSLTILFSLRYMEEKRFRFLILMAMGAAMATLEKWHGAIGIGYTGFIILLNCKHIKELFLRGIGAVLSYAAWIFILCPNLIFHFKSAIVDGFINIAVYDGGKGEAYHHMLLQYGKFGLQHYGGIVYIILIVVGIIYVIRNFMKQYMIFLMGILKTLILCFLNRQVVRWGLELYFCELLLASMGIYWLILSRGKWKVYITGYCAALILFLDFASGSLVYAAVATYSENDTRLIQEKECLAFGITPENTVSAYYTGFSPGGMNYTSGTAIRENFKDYFEIRNDELYRNTERINYAVVNISDIREKELEEIIMNNCPIIFSYDSVYNDIFWDPFNSVEVSWNDVRIIYENINIVVDVINGALLGRDINVYDVSGIPCL